MSTFSARLAGLVLFSAVGLSPGSAPADTAGLAAPSMVADHAPLTASAVAADVAALLERAFPQERIEVRTANAGLVLSGQVSGPETLQQALALAQRHTRGRVSNLMRTGPAPVITVTLGLAEMPPSVARNLTASMAMAGMFALNATDPDLFGSTGAMPGLSGKTLDLPGLVAALESKGVLRLHAGPTLSAFAGEAANLPHGAGCAGRATTTGPAPALSLTASLAEGGRIAVKISPCQTALSPDNPVTVVLADGQTIAVAGVLPGRDQLLDDPDFGATLAAGDGGLTEVMLLISARIERPDTPHPPLAAGPTQDDTYLPTRADAPSGPLAAPEPFTLSLPRLR